MRRIVETFGVTRLWVLREGPPSYEIDLDLFDPRYEGLEGFWFTNSLDWVIYASHESSITVGGDALRAAIENAWPGWRERIWTTPFYR